MGAHQLLDQVHRLMQKLGAHGCAEHAISHTHRSMCVKGKTAVLDGGKQRFLLQLSAMHGMEHQLPQLPCIFARHRRLPHQPRAFLLQVLYRSFHRADKHLVAFAFEYICKRTLLQRSARIIKIGIAGQVDNAGHRPAFAHHAVKLQPRRSGHFNIGQQNIHAVAVHHGARLVAAVAAANLQPVLKHLLKHMVQSVGNDNLVIDNKKRFHAASPPCPRE